MFLPSKFYIQYSSSDDYMFQFWCIYNYVSGVLLLYVFGVFTQLLSGVPLMHVPDITVSTKIKPQAWGGTQRHFMEETSPGFVEKSS
jgi:hypothetical protein